MMMENLLERTIFSRIRHGCLLLEGPTRIKGKSALSA
jgi:hypothetical protein